VHRDEWATKKTTKDRKSRRRRRGVIDAATSELEKKLSDNPLPGTLPCLPCRWVCLLRVDVTHDLWFCVRLHCH